MNYIILLWEDMKQLCSHLGIEDGNPNAVYLANQSLQMGDRFYYRRKRHNIYIHTPQIILRAVQFEEDDRDLFVKKIELSSEKEFGKELPFLQKLPGEWSLISKSEWHRRRNYYENHRIMESRISLWEEQDLDSYMDDWRMLDQYNDRILKEMDQKKARSRSCFKPGSQNGKELVLLLEKYPYDYEKGMQVEIQNLHDRNERYRGTVIKVMEESAIMVELQDEKAVNDVAFSNKEYQIALSNQGMITNFNRQKRAMEKLFQKTSVNPNMGEILLKKQRNVNVQKINREELRPYLERFGENEIQKKAFIHALETENIYLIQGPPGTGKTTVITELVNYITAHGQNVLLSSSSHAAVDNVLEKIDRKDSMIPIRLGKGEDISPEVKKYTLAACTERLQKSILRKLEQQKIYEEEEESFVNKLKEEYQLELELLENEIQEKRGRYGLLHYSEEELNYIKEYLKWNQECKDCYQELEVKKNSVERIRKEYEELQKKVRENFAQQNLLEKQSQIIFHSELKEQKLKELRHLQSENSELKKKLKEINIFQAEAEYRKLQESYERITSDMKHTREILLKKRQDSKEPLHLYVHRIQSDARKIQELLRKKRKREKAKNTFIRKEKELFSHRKELLERTKDLRLQWQEQVPYINGQIEDMYIETANVIAATCNGIASFENQKFGERAYDYVIVDEAAHCNTLDLLIPLTMGKKVILVGDQKQLYPMLPILEDTEYGRYRDNGYSGKGKETGDFDREKEEIETLREICKNTLFKQLYEERLLEESKIMLEVQYRMTPRIGNYISDNFYEGRLRNGIMERCGVSKVLPSPLLWLDTGGTKETFGKYKRSCKNEGAVKRILYFLHQLDGTLYEEKTAGIICYYRLQADEISLLLEKHNFQYLKVECDTIDAFQGKEKDIIVIDLVRTEKYTRFIDDANRLNVAVSRAKEMVIMAASVSYIRDKQYEHLERLYYYVKEKGGLLDGRLYGV